MMYQSAGYGVNTHNGGGILEVPDSNFRTDQRVFHHRQPYVPIGKIFFLLMLMLGTSSVHSSVYKNERE